MKTLYLECTMGAAGDMLMAALYELLDEAQREDFLNTMNALGLHGVEVSPVAAKTSGITGTHMQVLVHGREEHHHEHHHEGCCGHSHVHSDGCGCGHDHNHEQDPAEARRELITLAAGAVLLGVGLLLHISRHVPGWISTAVLLAAFLVVAAEIMVQAANSIRHGDVFGESFLMAIAGIGAVCIGEIPEGVLVFLLYRLGEYLQTRAVSSSRKSISALLDVRPDRANLLENGQSREVEARDIQVGQTILVRPGEKVPLDGVVLEGSSQLDTAALTGESVPRDISAGQPVMAGCINLSGALELWYAVYFMEEGQEIKERLLKETP